MAEPIANEETPPRQANKRGAARLAAVQALYQMDVAGAGVLEIAAEYESFRLGKEVDGAQYREADAQWFKTLLHGVLRDQQAVAGIGRRLANEICHRAKLSPFASAAKLDAEQVGRLAAAAEACIAESLTEERGRDHMAKSAERGSAVHHHVGDPCPVCGDTIRSVEYRSYTVAYCPTCQTGGKVLADNTTSKFLK